MFNLIIVGSPEWEELTTNLALSHKKSNRDVLCTACWKIYRYMKNRTHLEKIPNHRQHVLITNMFTDEEKFLDHALINKKAFLDGANLVVVNPYFLLTNAQG